MKYFSCALCLCLLFPLSAAASSIDSVEIYLEDPHAAEVLPEVENSTEPFTVSYTHLTLPTICSV